MPSPGFVPTSAPEPFTSSREPQPSTKVHQPVEPFSSKRALSRSVKPPSPPSQVNSFIPVKTPPHGVKWVLLSPPMSHPDSQPGMFDSNMLDAASNSTWSTMSTG